MQPMLLAVLNTAAGIRFSQAGVGGAAAKSLLRGGKASVSADR